TLRADVGIHTLGLHLRHADRARERFGACTMVESPQREVHLVPRQAEIELVLSLRQAVGVGRRPRVADLRRQAEVARKRIDLRFVEMRDGLYVRRAVAVLDEEAVVVLEPV